MTSSAIAGQTVVDEATPRQPSAGIVAAGLGLVIVLWGVGPPVTKLITVPPVVAALLRFWITVPLLWGIAYATGRRMTLDVLRKTALAGALFGMNMIFLFFALQNASVAVMAVVQSLNPAVVLLVAGRWLGERATLQHVLWTGVGIAGVVVVVVGGKPEVDGNAFGVVAAVISMLAFVGYYVINRRVRSSVASIDPIQWMAGATLFAALTVSPVALVSASPSDFGRIGSADWMYMLFIALVVGIISHVMMSWVHGYVPASRSSPALLASNVAAVAIAWPLHDEPLTWVQAAGGVVVLASVLAILRRPPVAETPGAIT